MMTSSLPTIYEHYTKPSIETGLTTSNSSHFLLNNRPLTIYSGAMHYFRVPRPYWRDRLRKLKAAGLNTVETYVPWNLHEETPGKFDFGAGGTNFQDFLDIAHFLTIAQEEDLLAIVRPGPYICSEWDFGGLPSWLLKDSEVQIRRNNPTFLEYVGKYFAELFKILAMFQFTKGGPVIAFQVENEYGNVKVPNEPIDMVYLLKLVDMFKVNGITELLFTSDTPSNGNDGSIKGLLNTANFQTDAIKEFEILRGYQKDHLHPLMVMEFWSGWFDHWGEKHHQISTEQFRKELEDILKAPGSINFYMFHGGTNWGFLNGANIMEDGSVRFDTSSYDYDAPLSESGDYTDKYHVVVDLIRKHNKVPIKLPLMPRETEKVKYDDVPNSKMMKLFNYLKAFDGNITQSRNLKTMEYFDQLYGYICYSKVLDLEPGATLRIPEKVKDTIIVLINAEMVNQPFEKMEDINGFGYWLAENTTIELTKSKLTNAKLDLLVENFGRVNYGKLYQFNQFRGLSSVFIDEKEVFDWQITKLSFSKQENLTITAEHNGWEDANHDYLGPALYKFNLFIEEMPKQRNPDGLDEYKDTFLDMSNWSKGIVIVNGFVLTRYFKLGPQQTCYLPGAFLHIGNNDIVVFEHFKSDRGLKFSDRPIFYTMK